MEVLAGDDDFIAEMASTLARPFRFAREIAC
jgi:hypothetical protein